MLTPLEEKLQLKNRIVGVLLRDARESAGRSITDCYLLLGISESDYRAFETGHKAPTLPQLEVLAYFLNVPIGHFWGTTTLAAQREEDELRERVPEMMMLRQRIIAVRLRQLREQSSLSLAEVSSRTNLPLELLQKIEMGQESLELNQLEVLANALNASLEDLIDSHSTIGNWLQTQQEFKEFSKLSPEMRAFLTRPVNRSYLELAVRLSEMNVGKLRDIAESILEITY